MNSSESTRIYMSSPDVGVEERAALMRAMDGGWIAPLGPEVDAFEGELAERCGRAHAVALNSGTAALHLALLDVGAGPGTSVIVPTMTFVATANAARYTGADVVFVDCDATGNLSPELLESALRALAADGVDVAAIVPVDLLGRSADYTRLLPIADRHGIHVISDAAEALGARHAGQPAGSFGRAAALSFNGNKIITTSGGGALVTDDQSIATRARYLSAQARQSAVHYEHTEVGYNYRMSNLLAALGRAQLGRLDEMMKKRRAHRERYAALFADVDGVEIFQRNGDGDDNCWLTSLLIDERVTGWAPAELREVLATGNVESRPLWKPMHLQPVFEEARTFADGTSEQLFKTGLTVPSGSALSDADVARVERLIVEFLGR